MYGRHAKPARQNKHLPGTPVDDALADAHAINVALHTAAATPNLDAFITATTPNQATRRFQAATNKPNLVRNATNADVLSKAMEADVVASILDIACLQTSLLCESFRLPRAPGSFEQRLIAKTAYRQVSSTPLPSFSSDCLVFPRKPGHAQPGLLVWSDAHVTAHWRAARRVFVRAPRRSSAPIRHRQAARRPLPRCSGCPSRCQSASPPPTSGTRPPSSWRPSAASALRPRPSPGATSTCTAPALLPPHTTPRCRLRLSAPR